MNQVPNKTFLTRKQVRERYNVADRTVARWVADPELGFTQPLVINDRQFFALDEIETWERLRASVSRKAA